MNLSSNKLCGVDYNDEGTYSAEGIIALSEALKFNASLTQVFAFCPFSNCAPFGGRGMFGMF